MERKKSRVRVVTIYAMIQHQAFFFPLLISNTKSLNGDSGEYTGIKKRLLVLVEFRKVSVILLFVQISVFCLQMWT